MIACLYVGIGGFMGAVCRYLLSGIIQQESFPFATMLINFIGSFVIGFVIGISQKTAIPKDLLLLLKVGVCGGFTTFSTFSAETLALFEKRQYLMGGGYAAISVLICVFGVWLGKWVTK